MKNYKSIFKVLLFAISFLIIYQTSLLYFSGSKIPDFLYADIKNKIVKGSNLPKSRTLFIFFSTNCNYCSVAINEIKKLATNRKDINYVLRLENVAKMQHQAFTNITKTLN